MNRLETVFRGRSKCPHCHHTLFWYDLVPIVSYILLRGRCRYCKKLISPRYPIVEFSTGLLALSSVLTFGVTPLALAIFAFLSTLLVIFAYDLYHKIIPDIMVTVAAVLSILVAYFWGVTIVNSGLGVAVVSGFLGVLYLLGGGRWMGLGDVKLGVPLGVAAGFAGSIVTLSVAFGLGAVVGILLLLQGKAKPRSAIPFGPFLVIGSYVALFLGESIVTWYLKIF